MTSRFWHGDGTSPSESLLPATDGSRARRDLSDDVDLQLIAALTDDGRSSNRALAAQVGLAETTVASRIQTLLDRRVLGVTALVDWRAAGYAVDMWLQVTVGQGRVDDVGADIGQLEGVLGVYVTFGFVDLVVHVVARDLGDALAFLAHRIAGVRGIADIRVNTSLRSLKYSKRFGRLPPPPTTVALPEPCVPIDDLDRRIIESLIADGRQSNRAMARELGVAEGTVRGRLRRLEAADLVRIVAQSDPFRSGVAAVFAMIGIRVAPQQRLAIAEELAARDESTIVALTTGDFDVFTVVFAASRADLTAFVVETVRAMPGVHSTYTAEVLRTLALSNHFSLLS